MSAWSKLDTPSARHCSMKARRCCADIFHSPMRHMPATMRDSSGPLVLKRLRGACRLAGIAWLMGWLSDGGVKGYATIIASYATACCGESGGETGEKNARSSCGHFLWDTRNNYFIHRRIESQARPKIVAWLMVSSAT